VDRRRVYLDYNATAPIRPEAASVWARLSSASPQNPSSIHWAGQEARRQLRIARDDLAAELGCSPEELIFTSGGSESNTLALLGTAPPRLDPRREVAVSAIEHPSVMSAVAQLTSLHGMHQRILPVRKNGSLDLDAAASLIGPHTRLVSLMLANNETGVLQPVREVAAIARAAGALIHCDATQAAGKMPLSLQELEVDLLTLGGHKFGAGHGFGLLYVRAGVDVKPLFGGHQQDGRRAGTENVIAVAAAAAALRAANGQLPNSMERLGELRDRLETGLLTSIDGSWVNGAGALRLCNTLSIGFDSAEGEALVIALDLEGIAASSGSACTSGTLEPSGVLTAMGQDAARASAAVRFSLGAGNEAQEIDRVLEVMPSIVAANRDRR
jgi:cysteine desulfurase